jgi:hypothetical protein
METHKWQTWLQEGQCRCEWNRCYIVKPSAAAQCRLWFTLLGCRSSSEGWRNYENTKRTLLQDFGLYQRGFKRGRLLFDSKAMETLSGTIEEMVDKKIQKGWTTQSMHFTSTGQIFEGTLATWYPLARWLKSDMGTHRRSFSQGNHGKINIWSMVVSWVMGGTPKTLDGLWKGKNHL